MLRQLLRQLRDGKPERLETPPHIVPQRDIDGRFVSDERARIRSRTAWLRRQMNLPPLPILQPNRDDFHD